MLFEVQAHMHHYDGVGNVRTFITRRYCDTFRGAQCVATRLAASHRQMCTTISVHYDSLLICKKVLDTKYLSKHPADVPWKYHRTVDEAMEQAKTVQLSFMKD